MFHDGGSRVARVAVTSYTKDSGESSQVRGLVNVLELWWTFEIEKEKEGCWR